MSKATDPALYESGFERIAKDRYWTEPWVTNILLRHLTWLGDMPGKIWEPAAGRGDMARVFMDHGLDVVASDIDMSEFDPGLCDSMEHNFLDDDFDPAVMGVTKLFTNPPYEKNKAERFVRRALALDDVQTVAMLLRSEFGYAGGRVDLFEDCPFPFAFEIRLTTRPRWDWWFRETPEASPRHNFSWFVWDRGWDERCTTYWAGKPKREK